MDTHVTWQPLAVTYDINDNGKLDPRERRALPDSAFAFPYRRELPLVDEELTREGTAVRAVPAPTPAAGPPSLAANNIRAAARYFGIALDEPSP
jgi:hypothetical protein